MCKCITLGVLLLILLQLKLCCLKKRSRPSYKNIRKLPKSEVDVKAILFPCSISEEQFLNTTFGTNHKSLNNCSRKFIIRMTVNSGGDYCSKSDGFIPIRYVVDGITGRKKRLIHPIMVRIKREKMYQLYNLQLVKSLNAEAREEVLQYENTANFSGCDTSSSHPTCGYSFFNNKIIQFSEGFCCSCDQSINDQRQPCDGRPGERRYPTDMKLAVRNQRSKRTVTQSADEEKIYVTDILSEHEGHKPRDHRKRQHKIIVSDKKSCNLGNNKIVLTQDGELETHITSEYPTTSANYKLDSRKYLNNTPSKECKSTVKHSTRKSINISCSVNKPNHNISSLERIVYEVIPIMNKVDSDLDSDIKNISILFEDEKNTTKSLNNVHLNNISKFKRNLPSGSFKLQKIKNMKNNNSVTETVFLKPSNPRHQNNHIGKKETCERQIRGGQSCSRGEVPVPCYAEPKTYFESAHCLRFSDLWYNVYRLINPKLESYITVKIYAKHKRSRRKVCWENLTKHVPGRVGTVNEVLTDDKGSILITYSSDNNVAYSLDCSTDLLLVPQPLTEHCKNTELRSASRGGPSEYLVLKENEVSFDGDECDRAGVTYATFARQPYRCQREAGSCLKNQPLQFWREDKKAHAEGKQGQYFLSNYITVIEQPILLNTTSNQVVLRAPYYEQYRSQIVVELNADLIDIIADRSKGQITEVYVVATSEKTVVKAVVSNMGIAADLFSVDLVNCTHTLGPIDFDKPGKFEIPPQHRVTCTATISTPLRFQQTTCELAAYSIENEVVASRRILIVRGERCICVWHCQCVCHNYPRSGLICIPLNQKEFNRAGLPGHLPGDASGTNCKMFFVVLQAMLFFFLFLLWFGLFKAVLGICFPLIAAWKLWYVMPNHAKCHRYHFDPELKHKSIVYDCSGYPVHPYSFKRSVHFLPRCTEFIVNLLFFILVARSYIWNQMSRRNILTNTHQYYEVKSPCRTACPNMGRARLMAGGEVKDPRVLADRANKQVTNQNYKSFRDDDGFRAQSNDMKPHLKHTLSRTYLHHR